MQNFSGGDRVSPGQYLEMADWAIEAIPSGGGTLPGDPSVRYVRLPAVLALLAAPMMGAALAFYLPVIGVFVVLQHVLSSLFGIGRRRAES